jgi:hypothetical protein
MNFINILPAAVFIATLGTALPAVAQDAPAVATTPAPADRAAVKSETRASEAAGTMPHGDLPIPATTPAGPATDRSALKKQTADYNKVKNPSWMPNNGNYSQGNTMKSTASRTAVKADAKAAEADQQIPRGQAVLPGATQ